MMLTRLPAAAKATVRCVSQMSCAKCERTTLKFKAATATFAACGGGSLRAACLYLIYDIYDMHDTTVSKGSDCLLMTAGLGHSVMVRDVMTPSVSTIRDNDTVQRAAEIMARQDIGALPVTDPNGSRLTGFLTDRDIAIRLAGQGMDPRSTLVETIKTQETPRYVFEDEPIDHVAHNM